jgi:adenosine deaminase
MELKRMMRQSLEHSFLPGPSLWAQTGEGFKPVSACTGDVLGKEKPSAACLKFIDASERAQEQWKLESAFGGFERKF